MADDLAPVPMRNVVTDDKTQLMDPQWVRWLTSMSDRVNSSPSLLFTATSGTVSASIPATSAQTAPLSAGLYRVSYYLQVVTPASVSSSITFTLSWTNAYGVVCSKSGAALTGNATATQQNDVWAVSISASTDIEYSVAYVSVGTAMTYSVMVNVEAA